jgi:TM2 domain-containing membrane protein YozV
MIGHIESYDEERQTGAIKFEDKFYEFHLDDWDSDVSPKIGDDVDFMPENDGRATSVGPVGAYLHDRKAVKNHYVAATLGLLFGAIGLHRLYLGFYGLAIAQMAVTYVTGGFGVVWGFVEGVLLLGGQINKDAKKRPLK